MLLLKIFPELQLDIAINSNEDNRYVKCGPSTLTLNFLGFGMMILTTLVSEHHATIINLF